MAERNLEDVNKDMLIEQVVDKGGAKMRLQVVDGQYFPSFPAEVIRNMASVQIRPDDVILAGYLKAGTHWVWEIIRMLLAGTTEVSDEEKDQGMIEQTSQKLLDAMPSPRCLNTHVHFGKLPTQVFTQNPKIVYLTRNPKDTAVSMFHHHRKLKEYYSYDGTFENYLYLFFEGKVDYGSWFDHIKNWTDAIKENKHLKIYVANYEDLIVNPEEQIQKLAEFLNVSPPEGLIPKVVQECSLDRMRDKKGKYDLDAEGKSIMYRKGQVGDWKNYFNDSRNDWFDEAYKQWTATLKTPFHWSFDLTDKFEGCPE